MDQSVLEQVLHWVDYAGVAVFAITGCLVAAKKGLDVISFILLAIVTGIGGGTFRDMILNRPVFWVQEPDYLIICAVTGILMFFCAQRIHAYGRWIIWGDAVGISVFTVSGAGIALSMGAHWSVCVTMGVITSIVGGIIRDLLAGEPSLIVRKEIYATACALGALTFIVVREYFPGWGVPAGMLATFSLRAAAISYRLHLPGYHWSDGGQHRRKSDQP